MSKQWMILAAILVSTCNMALAGDQLYLSQMISGKLMPELRDSQCLAKQYYNVENTTLRSMQCVLDGIVTGYYDARRPDLGNVRISFRYLCPKEDLDLLDNVVYSTEFICAQKKIR